MHAPRHVRNIVRVLPLFAAVIALGCGAKQHDARTVSYNCPANTAEISALERDIPAFTKRSGITITLNPFSGDEKLVAMMAAAQAPDIFYTNSVMRDKFAAEHRVLDLRPFLGKSALAQRLRPEILRDGASIDGGVYSIGNWSFTCGVYYNRALFDAAGVPHPKPDWTWDDMRAAAAKLTADTDGDGMPDRYGIYIPSHFIEAFEHMNHAPVERGALFLSIPAESRETYARYLALMRDGLMPDLRRVQAMGMQAAQMLQSGRVAMLVEALPNASLYESLTIDWDVAPLPRFAGKEPQYFRSGSGGLSISASCPNPSAAWEALSWIIGEASFYQPNPVLRDADVAGGWERRYPALAKTGFREVWARGERAGSADIRYFVRFSSWTMTPIMERLQPLLDRLWAGSLTVDGLVAETASINAAAARAIDEVIANPAIAQSFRDALRAQRAGGAAK